VQIETNVRHDITHYESLGLIANPFRVDKREMWVAIAAEILSAGNQLLGAILSAGHGDDHRPIWVEKPLDLEDMYPLKAIAGVEYALANDEKINVLHVYVPLAATRIGTIRATLGGVAERLVYRDFNKTLECFIDRVLAEPDTDLTSFAVLGPDGLGEFAVRFNEDRTGVVEALFGTQVIERHMELAQLSDLRSIDLERDGDGDESAPELDATVGESIGAVKLAQAEAEAQDEAEAASEAQVEADPLAGVLDYLVEYAKEHVSPVVARALRVYRDRGEVATVEELKITKAPRKTLAAVIEFARTRFDGVALIFDEFEYWKDLDQGLRVKIVGALSELRWAVDGRAIMVFAVAPDEAPELEESFAASRRLRWGFDALIEAQGLMDTVNPATVESWLESAAAPGAEHIHFDGGLEAIATKSESDFATFIRRAEVAVEDAATRGVNSIDDLAVQAALEGGTE